MFRTEYHQNWILLRHNGSKRGACNENVLKMVLCEVFTFKGNQCTFLLIKDIKANKKAAVTEMQEMIVDLCLSVVNESELLGLYLICICEETYFLCSPLSMCEG